MNLNTDAQRKAPRCPSCDRIDLLHIAVSTGSQFDLNLEWMLDRTPRPLLRTEGK
jgi:hypothetical protein